MLSVDEASVFAVGVRDGFRDRLAMTIFDTPLFLGNTRFLMLAWVR